MLRFLKRHLGWVEQGGKLVCPHCERKMDAGHDADACRRKGMSRRFFFGVLGAAAVTAALPDPALFVRAPVRFQAFGGNPILTPEMITLETLGILQKSMVAGMAQIQREYNQLYSMQAELLTIGNVVSVRTPILIKG